jgi:hypothetical protein
LRLVQVPQIMVLRIGILKLMKWLLLVMLLAVYVTIGAVRKICARRELLFGCDGCGNRFLVIGERIGGVRARTHAAGSRRHRGSGRVKVARQPLAFDREID